jgi:hypothetical protein
MAKVFKLESSLTSIKYLLYIESSVQSIQKVEYFDDFGFKINKIQ